MAESQPRQNYNEETEATINKQINIELYASYVYLAMAMHFDRDDVAFANFYKFFKERSDEEREHAHKFMKYQNMRGGRIVLQDIKCPEAHDWSCLEAMQAALDLEKSVNESLLALNNVAEKHGDAQFVDWLAGEYLDEQVKDIKLLSDHVTNLKRVGTGLGEFMFDKEGLSE